MKKKRPKVCSLYFVVNRDKKDDQWMMVLKTTSLTRAGAVAKWRELVKRGDWSLMKKRGLVATIEFVGQITKESQKTMGLL